MCTYAAGDGSTSTATDASSTTMSVLDFVSQPMILDRLLESRKQFDAILKGLHKFLERKRTAFPRFYFLSDAELLEVREETMCSD